MSTRWSLDSPELRALRPCYAPARRVIGRGDWVADDRRSPEEHAVGDLAHRIVRRHLNQPRINDVLRIEAGADRSTVDPNEVVIDISSCVGGEWRSRVGVAVHRVEWIDASNDRSIRLVQLENGTAGARIIDKTVGQHRNS